MVKDASVLLSMAVAIVLPIITFADTTLQVSDLVGKPLDQSLVSRLPRRNGCSRQSVFLGSVRANIEGNFADLTYHFDDALRIKMIGDTDLEAITKRQKQNIKKNADEMRSMWGALVSYSEVHSNEFYLCSGAIQSNSPQGVETNILTFVEYKTNSTWRVSDFLIDGISIADEGQ